MCQDPCPATPAHVLPACVLCPDVAEPWGDVSADQADGFAPADDTELPVPDVNDDRGYGFGV